jgi:hypothetical protein
MRTDRPVWLPGLAAWDSGQVLGQAWTHRMFMTALSPAARQPWHGELRGCATLFQPL